MIARLHQALGRNLGNAFMPGPGQRAEQFQMPGIEQELSHEGEREITVRLFYQQQVAELAFGAQIGQRIGIPAPAFHLAREPQPQPGLTDQIQRHVGQGQILFDGRRMAAPFAQAMAEYQGGVPHAQQIVKQCAAHHICPISSGISKKVGWR